MTDTSDNYDCATSQEKWIADVLDKVAKLTSREIEDCFLCGKHITRMEKIGRCTYARPCGCRLWQGQVPDAWHSAKEKLI